MGKAYGIEKQCEESASDFSRYKVLDKSRLLCYTIDNMMEEAGGAMRRFRKTACMTTLALLCGLTGCGDSDATEIRFSWWGGDSRHKPTLSAVEQFTAMTDLDVKCEYGAWSGWEESIAAALYAGTEADVIQVNQSWLRAFQSEQTGFLDLYTLSDTLDFSQYDPEVLEACTVDGQLLCLPVSLTGRVFFWNETVFQKAGLAPPSTLAELIAAGEVFRETIGDTYYPLALGWYDRMLFLVYWLQSTYGRDWVAEGQLQYSVEEIAEGLAVIQMLEETHVIPPLKEIIGGGADSFDKDERWITGQYGGIYEWDSAAGKFEDALADGQTLVVGSYFSDLAYDGGFTKIALGFAISKHTDHPQTCGALIAYLTSNAEAVDRLEIERGVPLNRSAYAYCEENGLLDSLSGEAYRTMQAASPYELDADFESPVLKGTGGVYEDVFTGLAYGDYSLEQAAQVLHDGVRSALNANAS